MVGKGFFMKLARFALASLLSAVLCIGTAGAATFSYVFSGEVVGGTLNGTAFAAGAYRIVGTADTADIVQTNALFTVALQEVVVEARFGTVEVTSPINLFMDNDMGILGLSHGTVGVHLIEVSDPALVGYELKTAARVQSLLALFMNWDDASFGAVTSTGGPLVFNKGGSITTFEASRDVQVAPIPLPAGGLLLAAAIAAPVALRRRGPAPAR
jgi:hypothetical protein